MGLAGGLRRLTQLGIFSPGVHFTGGLAAKAATLADTTERYAWCLGRMVGCHELPGLRPRADNAQDSAWEASQW